MKRLNNNEVKEVARMQRLITKYENIILALYLKAKTGREIQLLQFGEPNLRNETTYLWNWIKEHRNEEK